MFNISPAPERSLGKARQQSLFLGHGHVLVLASAIRPRFKRLDAVVIIGHVRTVHVLSDTPIAAAITGCVIPLSRKSTI